MINSLASFTKTSFYGAGQARKFFNSIPPSTNLMAYARILIYPLQNAGLGLFGAKELVYDRVKIKEKIPNLLVKKQADKLKIFVKEFLRKREFEKIPFGFHTLHGACYLASGISGLMSSFNLGAAAVSALGIAANGFFLMANVVGLEYNVNLYEQAGGIDLKNAPAYICEAVSRIKKSAVLGIVSNLNYIMVALTALFGLHFALTLCFTGIAIATGCIKILYDYFYLA